MCPSLTLILPLGPLNPLLMLSQVHVRPSLSAEIDTLHRGEPVIYLQLLKFRHG